MNAEPLFTDCHTHLYATANLQALKANCDAGGISRANIVSLTSPACVNQNPAAFAAKFSYPGFFYIFGGLDHTAVRTGSDRWAFSLEEQVEMLQSAGCDGLKLIESKPDRYPQVGIPLDSDYYAPMFERCASSGFPVLWHVADPEEFWDPSTTPKWALERGWGYGPSDVRPEVLYGQVMRVLEANPELVVIFPHFFFYSEKLEQAAALFDRYSGVHFDLAPGVEYLHNLSADPAASRDFLERYSDRILFGTDDFDSLTPEQARARADLVLRWLSSDEEFSLPAEADFLLGSAEDGSFHGLGLSEETLERICCSNFARIAADQPSPLDAELALIECRRLEIVAQDVGADPSSAALAAAILGV